VEGFQSRDQHDTAKGRTQTSQQLNLLHGTQDSPLDLPTATMLGTSAGSINDRTSPFSVHPPSCAPLMARKPNHQQENPGNHRAVSPASALGTWGRPGRRTQWGEHCCRATGRESYIAEVCGQERKGKQSQQGLEKG
jgi:hypothetical protein